MKEQLTHGDILHCRGSRLISRLIMRFTKSRWSHTALVVVVEGELFIIDAQRDGVNMRPFDAWHKKYGYTMEVSRPDIMAMPPGLRKRALSKIGVTAYDFESLFLRYPWMLITGKWKNRGDKEDDRMYCSEFVAWCYDHPNWFRMSPELVHEWCANSVFQTFKLN